MLFQPGVKLVLGQIYGFLENSFAKEYRQRDALHLHPGIFMGFKIRGGIGDDSDHRFLPEKQCKLTVQKR